MGFRLRLWSFPCLASMKALPKRKGNSPLPFLQPLQLSGLNESPSRKEGKCFLSHARQPRFRALMKAPPKREGNDDLYRAGEAQGLASMKVYTSSC